LGVRSGFVFAFVILLRNKLHPVDYSPPDMGPPRRGGKQEHNHLHRVFALIKQILLKHKVNGMTKTGVLKKLLTNRAIFRTL
ncbi:hypothetical protein, partial [Aeromonas dhakensis]|uniref:hypothetical protein n=1 Tax=Aeromonas dhakensis TaxID=196024 RepID=UPI00195CA084